MDGTLPGTGAPAGHGPRRPPGAGSRRRLAATGRPDPVGTTDLLPLLEAGRGRCRSTALRGVADGGHGRGGRRGGPARAAALVAVARSTRRVLVSDELGAAGVVPATPASRRFRDELGRLDTAVAVACERALLTTAGRALALLG